MTTLNTPSAAPDGSVDDGGRLVAPPRTPSAEGSSDGVDLMSAWGPRRQTVAGLRFVASTPTDAADAIVRAAVRPKRSKGEHIHLANAYSVSLAARSPALAASSFVDGWNLPDGKPLTWVSRTRRHRPGLRQVPGPILFLDVCDRGRKVGLRHYLLGGAPAVLELLQQQLEHQFPGIEIVGADSPPFREPTIGELADRDEAIRLSGAHVVWVGLGTPKQDIEAARLAGSLPIVSIAVGAGFDYAAGTLRHAPGWISAIGFEWLFRLAMEPKRLWRRYLFGNSRFIREVVRERTRSGRR